MLTLIYLAACTPEWADTGEETGHADSDTDTGGDRETGNPDDTADSAVDSGETGHADTGDSGPDDTGTPDTGETGDTGGEGCDLHDLLWTAEVRDATGAVGTVFTTADVLTMAAVVTNPCTTDVSFVTPDSCLVTSMMVSDATGGDGVAFACADVVTTWVIPAGAAIEEAAPWGRLPAATWTLDVSFNVASYAASQAFEVR